jgi:hypothetical protein
VRVILDFAVVRIEMRWEAVLANVFYLIHEIIALHIRHFEIQALLRDL